MTPPQRPRVSPPLGLALRASGLGLLYGLLYWLVVESAQFGSPIGAAFWPAAGITVVVLLRSPRADWPFLLLAVGVVEFALDMHYGFSAAVSAVMALANTAEPLVAATLLLRGGRAVPDLTQREGLTRFLACAVIAGPAVGALIGSVGAALLSTDPVFPRLPRWFVGDAVGVLVVAPAVKLLARHRPTRDMIAPLTGLTVVALALVGPWTLPSEAGLPFLILPALGFVALRLGPVGAATGVLLVAIVVEVAAVTGHGPFVHEGPFGGLVVVQMFLAMGSITSLTVGVLVHDLVSRDRVEALLREQALHDELTGLANRRLLLDRLEQANLRLGRPGAGSLAVLYVDLDGFKAVNDRCGHAAGDEVLRVVARRLRAVVRPHDTVARLGGDEFVVIAEGLQGDDDVDHLAARLVEACDSPTTDCGAGAHLGASVGLAVAAQPVADPETLLQAADRSMYRAKQAGGGTAARGRSATH